MAGVHLVTYATPRFRHRQLILGASARINRVATTVTHWTPTKLADAGFHQSAPDIRPDERGAGFYAWKPFVIHHRLLELADGEVVFYCDVGRTFPFKLLDQPIDKYLEWMEKRGQEVMPGVEIPWFGPMSKWTKRDAFVLTNMDCPEVYAAPQIQASFSIWRTGMSSRALANKWMTYCFDRRLVSDDQSRCGLPELPEFCEHRWDQSLLTLCCLMDGIYGVRVGVDNPAFDTKSPSDVSRFLFGPGHVSALGRIFQALILPLEVTERTARRRIKSS